MENRNWSKKYLWFVFGAFCAGSLSFVTISEAQKGQFVKLLMRVGEERVLEDGTKVTLEKGDGDLIAVTISKPAPSPEVAEPRSKSWLTLDKYKRLRNGMTYAEVVAIIGREGVETMSSGEGKYKVTSYKWEGDDFQMIYVTLMGDKLTSKTHANLK